MGEIQKILFSDGVKATMRKARLFGPGLQREAARIAKMHGASVTPVNYKSEACRTGNDSIPVPCMQYVAHRT